MPRLDHLLARNLPSARSLARRLIEDGVVIGGDGQPLFDPRQDIPAAQLPLPVVVEGQPLAAARRGVPAAATSRSGYVTALRDDRHPVAAELLDEAPLAGELRPVGRLDLDTSGLLLWTTSGPWLQRLTHPKRAVPRALPGRPGPAVPARRRPTWCWTTATAQHPRAAAAAPGRAPPGAELARRKPTAWAEITIAGGAYHEVRRIFAALGSHVLGLCRVGVRPPAAAGRPGRAGTSGSSAGTTSEARGIC